MKKQSPDLVVVGVLMGAHGVRGDVRVKSFTAEPENIFDYAPLLSSDGTELLTPKAVRPAKDHFVVVPKQPRQKEDWDRMRGEKLHAPRTCLPDPDEDEFYIEDLVGLAVYTGGSESIGRVKAVLNHGAGDLIEVQQHDGGKAVLVPFTKLDVPVVDIAANRLVVATFETWSDESKPEDQDDQR